MASPKLNHSKSCVLERIWISLASPFDLDSVFLFWYFTLFIIGLFGIFAFPLLHLVVSLLSQCSSVVMHFHYFSMNIFREGPVAYGRFVVTAVKPRYWNSLFGFYRRSYGKEISAVTLPEWFFSGDANFWNKLFRRSYGKLRLFLST